jgi:hypothetical protein
VVVAAADTHVAQGADSSSLVDVNRVEPAPAIHADRVQHGIGSQDIDRLR